MTSFYQSLTKNVKSKILFICPAKAFKKLTCIADHEA